MKKNKIVIVDNINLINVSYRFADIIFFCDNKYYFNGVELKEDVIKSFKEKHCLYDFNKEIELAESIGAFIRFYCNRYFDEGKAMYDISKKKKVYKTYDPLVVALVHFVACPLTIQGRLDDLEFDHYVRYNKEEKKYCITESGIDLFIETYQNLAYEKNGKPNKERYWFTYFLDSFIKSELIVTDNEEKSKEKKSKIQQFFYKRKTAIDDYREGLLRVLASEQIKETNYWRNKELGK